jgi:hypothetical protein
MNGLLSLIVVRPSLNSTSACRYRDKSYRRLPLVDSPTELRRCRCTPGWRPGGKEVLSGSSVAADVASVLLVVMDKIAPPDDYVVFSLYFEGANERDINQALRGNRAASSSRSSASQIHASPWRSNRREFWSSSIRRHRRSRVSQARPAPQPNSASRRSRNRRSGSCRVRASARS